RLDLAANREERALMHVMFDDIGQVAPHDHAVPLRAFFLLAVRLPPFRGGNREVRAFVAVLRPADLRVLADVTDDHSLIPHRSSPFWRLVAVAPPQIGLPCRLSETHSAAWRTSCRGVSLRSQSWCFSGNPPMIATPVASHSPHNSLTDRKRGPRWT